MQTQTNNFSSSLHRGPELEIEHGYYNSATLSISSEKAFAACQDEVKIQRVLDDLPDAVENFLSLSLKSAESLNGNKFKIVWNNAPDSKIPGSLTFLLSPAPRGTWITAEANFQNLNWNEEGPSTLMNIFIKRMKALLETGEIPSTKGQPSGREQLPQNLH